MHMSARIATSKSLLNLGMFIPAFRMCQSLMKIIIVLSSLHRMDYGWKKIARIRIAGRRVTDVIAAVEWFHQDASEHENLCFF